MFIVCISNAPSFLSVCASNCCIVLSNVCLLRVAFSIGGCAVHYLKDVVYKHYLSQILLCIIWRILFVLHYLQDAVC